MSVGENWMARCRSVQNSYFGGPEGEFLETYILDRDWQLKKDVITLPTRHCCVKAASLSVWA